MKEEQPIFKVTDRRLFNPDGTPRDVERDEETKAETSTGETKQPAPASETQPAAASQSRESASVHTDAPADSSRESAGGAGAATAAAPTAEGTPDEDYAESEIPGADDPASFINFLMSIASNAAAALGMMEHPVTGERRVDLELAHHWIEVLGMLQQKTRGNLAPQEKQIFEGLLADLRMQYVSLTSARQPKAPRGFSGSDITGGR
jgi:hypothetical protein